MTVKSHSNELSLIISGIISQQIGSFTYFPQCYFVFFLFSVDHVGAPYVTTSSILLEALLIVCAF